MVPVLSLKAACLCAFTLLCGVVQAVRETKYYDRLSVAPDATEQEIKKAYRKAALKWHPDRNPDNKEQAEQKFREVAEAYEVLSEPEQRKVYDRFGEQGVKGNSGGGGSPNGHGRPGGFHFGGGRDPFEMFKTMFGEDFGGGRGGSFSSQSGDGRRTFTMHFSSSGGQPGGFAGGFGGGGDDGGSVFGNAFKNARQQQQQRAGGGRQAPAKTIYSGDPPVPLVTADSFPGPGDEFVTVVHFFHPDDANEKAAKVVQAVAGKLSPSRLAKFAAVDCRAHSDLCDAHGVLQTPGIQAFVPDEDSSVDFVGRVSPADLKAWTLRQIPSHVTTLAGQQDLDQFLQRCSLASGAKGERAAWAACAVLVTDKAEVSPLWASASTQFRGKVATAQIQTAVAQHVTGLKGTRTLSLHGFCNGHAAPCISEDLPEESKSKAIHTFLAEFRSGTKCRKEIKLEDAAQLARWPVAQLKALLVDYGLRCRTCFEKDDYRTFILEHVLRAATGRDEL
eukprot:jgi/Ulvmu1/6449/UM003_0079.1